MGPQAVNNANTLPLFALLVTDTLVPTVTEIIADIGHFQEAAMANPKYKAYMYDLTSTPGLPFWSSEITELRTRDATGQSPFTYSFDPIVAKVSIDYDCIGLPEGIIN